MELNKRGIPVTAIITQFVVVNVLLLTATFEKVINYVQFALTLSSALTVAGVIVQSDVETDLDAVAGAIAGGRQVNRRPGDGLECDVGAIVLTGAFVAGSRRPARGERRPAAGE